MHNPETPTPAFIQRHLPLDPLDPPLGKAVTYRYLVKNLSWRYTTAKKLFSLRSLPSALMHPLIKTMFHDHKVGWSTDQSEHYGFLNRSEWFDSIVRQFGSRGGTKAAKLKKEAQEALLREQQSEFSFASSIWIQQAPSIPKLAHKIQTKRKIPKRRQGTS